jgi:hypothetical protein
LLLLQRGFQIIYIRSQLGGNSSFVASMFGSLFKQVWITFQARFKKQHAVLPSFKIHVCRSHSSTFQARLDHISSTIMLCYPISVNCAICGEMCGEIKMFNCRASPRYIIASPCGCVSSDGFFFPTDHEKTILPDYRVLDISNKTFLRKLIFTNRLVTSNKRCFVSKNYFYTTF